MSAAKRVAHAAETIRARWEQRVASDPQTEAAQALEDSCQLLDPEVAAELERLRRDVESNRVDGQRLLCAEQRRAELEAVLATHRKDDQAEIERLRARVAELEAERANYVGREPTIAEEMAYLSRCIDSVLDLCDKTAAKGITSGGPFTVEAVRIAADGDRPAVSRPALPWAHVMSDDDLHEFLGDLVSAALNRWRHSPEVPDRETLADIERACAQWRTPGQGLRSDEPAEVFVPRTERSYWVAIAEALNAAHSAGMPVGIDLDGTLTDHNAWSVVWDRATERWAVAGYEDGFPPLDEASKASFAERAARESDPKRRVAWRMLAADVPDGEHYQHVHHTYATGHDLPETGGAPC